MEAKQPNRESLAEAGKKSLPVFLYQLWQWTWGFPQTLIGALLYRHYVNHGCEHFPWGGASVVLWTQRAGSMSLGRYLFLHPDWTPENRQLLAHEYGHTIQSLILGPLYLPAVGLPSILWASLPPLRRLRKQRNISYYAIYPENWASRLGDRWCPK